MRTSFASVVIFALGAAAALAGAGGCSSLDALLVANVSADGDVTAALLTATVTAGGLTRAIPVERADHTAFTLPPAQSFAVRIPAKYAGAVTLAVDALDADMHVVASGTTTTTVASGKRTDISLTLTKKPSLTIDPPSATLTIGHTQTFTTNLPADWSVMEAAGGSITSDGVYTAPMTPGTYHVLAALTADPSITASATVDVSDRTVALYVGHLGGSGNVDGTGTDARFGQAKLGSIDGADNLYLSDYDNHTIRVLKSSTGEVKTIAGQNGARAFADGPGPDARFALPYGPALDGAGNLFIPDSGNAIVRKLVVSTNVASTIAGQYGQVIGNMDGTGSAARFGSPESILLDIGNIAYVGDNSASYSVRRIDLGSLAVTTFAGNPGQPGAMDGTGTAAKFSILAGMASNRFDRIWVADAGNHAVREIVVATQAVTTIAGGLGTSGFTDATGTAARFNNPTSLFYDNNNGLYVTDAGNYAIRRIDTSTKAVTTVAGGVYGSSDGTGAAAKFGGSLNGLVLDGSSLLIGDGATVRRMVLSSSAVTTVAGAAGVFADTDGPIADAAFQYQSEMAADEAGDLFVYELGQDKIRKVSAAGMVTTLTQGGEPGKLAYGGGKLYVTMNDTLQAVDPTSGLKTVVVPSGVGYPAAVETDGASHVWIANGNAIVDVALPGGTVTTLAGGMTAGSADGVGAAASFTGPSGLAWDKAGALYVADGGNDLVRKIDLATKMVTTIAGLVGVTGTVDGTGAMARFSVPREMLYDGNGNLLIIDNDSTVRKLALATGAVSTYLGVAGHAGVRVGALPGSLNGPRSLARGPGGELYLLNYGESCILVVK